MHVVHDTSYDTPTMGSLIIIVDKGRVDIMNSLNKPLEDYDNLLDMLQR
jgi:hypothetical protein